MSCLAIAADASPGMERVLEETFLAARLLTASVDRAESAMREALESWYPGDGPADLFERALRVAVLRDIEWGPDPRGASGAGLAPELCPVLALPAEMRRCYVLAGMPAETCADMLRLHPRVAGELTCSALCRLPALRSRLPQ